MGEPEANFRTAQQLGVPLETWAYHFGKSARAGNPSYFDSKHPFILTDYHTNKNRGKLVSAPNLRGQKVKWQSGAPHGSNNEAQKLSHFV
jgi:hypothetical protein